MYLLTSYVDTQQIQHPYIMTIVLLIIVIPGFFVAGFIGSKIITLFTIGNREAKFIGIFCSIIGCLFVLLLGYTAITM